MDAFLLITCALVEVMDACDACCRPDDVEVGRDGGAVACRDLMGVEVDAVDADEDTPPPVADDVDGV